MGSTRSNTRSRRARRRPDAARRPDGRVAQLVEQGIENPRVGSSILSPATIGVSELIASRQPVDPVVREFAGAKRCPLCTSTSQLSESILMLCRLGPESPYWVLVDDAGQAPPQQAVGPFRRARRAVADRLCGIGASYPGVRAGTVHTPQGKEADVVVLGLGIDPGSAGAGGENAEPFERGRQLREATFLRDRRPVRVATLQPFLDMRDTA